MTETELKKKTLSAYRRLKKTHPDATIALDFKNPLQLLVATVLSAQCTDVQVNKVTATLFKKYKKPEDYLKHPQRELEKDIKSTGFFRQKTKSLRGIMQKLIDQHQGKVPADMESLTKLPGIGRKTANVILGNGFGVPGMPVDTHVKRVTNRIGMTDKADPEKIEAELTSLIPKKEWTQFSHTLIFHGRRICKARKPLCEECNITNYCDYYRTEMKN